MAALGDDLLSTVNKLQDLVYITRRLNSDAVTVKAPTAQDISLEVSDGSVRKGLGKVGQPQS